MQEPTLSRVISLDSTGTERNRLCKSIVIAIRELMQQKEPDAHSLDLVAYIVLALGQITANIEKTVVAWEKRDYWLKADKFRQQWGWTMKSGDALKKALLEKDWPAIAMQSITIGQKLSNIKVSDNHRLGTPWIGAWNKLQKM